MTISFMVVSAISVQPLARIFGIDKQTHTSNLFLLYKDIKIVEDFLKLCLSRFIFASYISLALKNTFVRAMNHFKMK